MNLSAKIISWRPTNAEILPIFAVYPLLNTNAASVPYSDASFASISAYNGWFPVVNLEARAPMPYKLIASIAACLTTSCVESPM
ncbi:hypothetical protein ANAPC1_00726 [Anaplasma phagocytophilum]|uniref:Uncharacterized protein n=1 Tax=Anaplasma phagocytophilum TaxID=948 RepID=A0AA45UTG0_ANAPH|nr:hypothetical protein ANAPC1_00726 [Anaplasma phagocytophilum]